MKKSILIVDGEETIRESLALILEDEGYSCMTASDGLSVMNLLLHHTFDLIILDLLLTRKGGKQMLEEIIHINSQVPVLILSSYFDVDLAAGIINNSGIRYMIKPLDFDELIDTVHHILPKVSSPGQQLR